LQAADKIFVDVDDEINFIVEKVLRTEKARVILVVPQNALVVSSLVSLKMLVQQILRSKKLVIIVTEDKFGQQLAGRANLLAVDKVSNISPEQWEAAQIKLESARTNVADRKEQLLTERGAITPKAEEIEDLSGTESSEVEDDTELLVDEDLPESEDARPPIQRVRRQPKLVQTGGFSVLAGGDILALSQQERANISPEDMDEDSSTTKPFTKPKNGFTGRDWTHATGNVKPANTFLSSIFRKQPIRRSPLGISDKDVQPFYKNKVLWAGAVILLGVIIAGLYIFAFVISSADIRITLKTAEIPVEGNITASTSATAVDIQTLTIPATVSVEKVNGSDTGSPSGQATRGNKAGGFVDVWNSRVGEAIAVAAGTVVTNPSNGLKYLVTTAITVPAATESGGVVTVGKSEDVRIEAETFGDQYNIDVSSTVIEMKLGDYPTSGTESVVVKRFEAISGGTTESFTAVSQEDVDGIQQKLVERLTKQGRDKLKNLVREGYTILSGTEEFEVTKVSSVPAVGEAGSRLDVSVEGEISILVVAKKDLQAAITALVQQNQDQEIDYAIDATAEESLTNIQKIEGGVTFTVSSSGSLKSQVDETEIREALSGKTVEEARRYLGEQVPEIDRFVLSFSPEFLPEFLKYIPRDPARIKLQVQ
jgi:hypothetical protein